MCFNSSIISCNLGKLGIISCRPLENCGLSRSFNNPLLDEDLMTGGLNVSSRAHPKQFFYTIASPAPTPPVSGGEMDYRMYVICTHTFRKHTCFLNGIIMALRALQSSHLALNPIMT